VYLSGLRADFYLGKRGGHALFMNIRLKEVCPDVPTSTAFLFRNTKVVLIVGQAL
jgi:hypothetical protein